MHKKIVELQKKLKRQYLWIQNVDEKEIINWHRFSMYSERVAGDLYIIERYLKNPNDNDYEFIVEYVLPEYKTYKGDGSYRVESKH